MCSLPGLPWGSWTLLKNFAHAYCDIVAKMFNFFCRPTSESKAGSNAGSFWTRRNTNFDITTHERTSNAEDTLTSQRSSESRRACPLRAPLKNQKSAASLSYRPLNEIMSSVQIASLLHLIGSLKFRCACSEKTTQNLVSNFCLQFVLQFNTASVLSNPISEEIRTLCFLKLEPPGS